MKVLIQEPVKEAVKEALAEQRGLTKEGESEEHHTENEATDGGTGMLAPRRIFPIVGIIGLALILRRMSEDRLETDRLNEIIGDEEQDTSMEEDMSKSSPTVSDGSSAQSGAETEDEIDQSDT